jgi:uncharacterized cupredoxin-like copper-binding protein
MNTLIKNFAVAGLIAILTGCSSGTTAKSTVTIAAQDVKFNTQEISVSQGKPVKLILDNKDQVLHDFSIDKLPVANKADHHGGGAHDMGGKNPDVHVSADGHKQGSIVFTRGARRRTGTGIHIQLNGQQGHALAGRFNVTTRVHCV